MLFVERSLVRKNNWIISPTVEEIGINIQNVRNGVTLLTQKICSIPLLVQGWLAVQRYGIVEVFYFHTNCILLESCPTFRLFQSMPGWRHAVKEYFHWSVFDRHDIGRKPTQEMEQKSFEPFRYRNANVFWNGILTSNCTAHVRALNLRALTRARFSRARVFIRVISQVTQA